MMSILDALTFSKRAPAGTRTSTGTSPLEKARTKLLRDLDAQARLARDPDYEIVTTNRAGQEKRRKPKSWVQGIDGDVAYLTIRYSNKTMPIGGKRGNFVRCNSAEIAATFETVARAVEAGELDEMIETMIVKARRKPRATPYTQTTSTSRPQSVTTVGTQ